MEAQKSPSVKRRADIIMSQRRMKALLDARFSLADVGPVPSALGKPYVELEEKIQEILIREADFQAGR